MSYPSKVLSSLVTLVLFAGLVGAGERGDGFSYGSSRSDPKPDDPPAACKGLKKSITVYRLEDRVGRVTSRQAGGYGYNYGYGGANANYSQSSDALSDMLMTSLESTGCFILVERKNLDDIEREQSLVNSGKTKATETAKAGNLIAAQIIVMGAVTAFEEHERGGVLGGITRSGRVGGIATDKARVTLDLRLVDSTSSEVLQTATASGDASSTALVVGGIPIGNIKVGTALWQKTPLGNASREAISNAVNFIVSRMKAQVWMAKVSQVDGDRVYINAGDNAGIRSGDSFFVYSVGDAITDPDTGAVLGVEETKVAVVDITDVRDKYSVGKVSATFMSGYDLKRGDILRER
ncbi:MAG: CsgG/HfaB family protein [bacterium]